MENGTSKSKGFAELLDSRFRIPGTDIRIGLDPIVGLLPGVGDWLGGVASLYFVFYATLSGARSAVLGRMLLTILIDIYIGAIPVLGEVFDIYWKANKKNAALIQELKEHPEKTTEESRFWIWTVFVQCVVLILGSLLLLGWLVAELMALMFG